MLLHKPYNLNHKISQKRRLLELLQAMDEVSPEVAKENGIENLRQQIHFLRKKYRYNILTIPEKKNTYRWIDND